MHIPRILLEVITARPAAALRRRTPSHLTGERFAQLSKAVPVDRLRPESSDRVACQRHLIERAGPASLCGKVVREGRQPGA